MAGRGENYRKALLLLSGKKVLVLEQNSYLGGGASTYQINHVDFDIGTYFVGQVDWVSKN